MFKRDRFADIALGLVLGLAIALLFLVISVPGFRDPSNSHIGQQHTTEAPKRNGNPIEATGFWSTYTSPRDTYAQWISALTSFASIAISVWAIKLVRDTLETNRHATSAALDAVVATRESISSQRAWLLHSGLTFHPVQDTTVDGIPIKSGFAFDVRFKNLGGSPALGVSPAIRRELIALNGSRPHFDVGNFWEHQSGAVVGQGTEFSAPLIFIDDKDTISWKSNQTAIVIYCKITYFDIFNRDFRRFTEATFHLVYNGTAQFPNGSTTHKFTMQVYGPQNTAS